MSAKKNGSTTLMVEYKDYKTDEDKKVIFHIVVENDEVLRKIILDEKFQITFSNYGYHLLLK